MHKNSLQLIDFVDFTGHLISGLVPVHDSNFEVIDPHEIAAVFDARKFAHIDYIFFRRFSDGRSSQIAAYVIDNNSERLNEDTLAKLHHQVWLHGAAPLLYVAWPSRIDILSCAREPDFWNNNNNKLQYSPAQCLDVEIKTSGAINKELGRFSAFRLADGTFWDDPSNSSLTNYDKAAHQSLINAIVEVDQALHGEKNPVLRRLLLLMVLIKYLEDRGVFPNEGWFGRYRSGARSFFDVLRGCNPEEVYKLLDFLERKFNGDIFRLDEDVLTKQVLENFATLVEGKILNNQRHLWKLYTFEHLPVEIISHLYQRFIRGGHGAVYTPPFLASLLLDHAMPYNNLSGKERVLDPACGSGIFLVGAFRRLVNVWRHKNNWKRLTVATLKDILKNSIFGTELDINAIDLTAFSLTLAVCDALQPDVIWNELHFESLKKSNLFEVDFFRELFDSNKRDSVLNNGFDVIIGNPPFESILSQAGAEVDKNARKKYKNRGSLPDKQVAYLFLEQSFNILRDGGTLCLIQPSGLLYNRNTTSFRNSIFSSYNIEAIFDFVSIRKLYEAADPKTVAVLAKAISPSENHHIKHWTFRRTASVRERICFELDHYDRHNVSQKQAMVDIHIWRINLLGGGRLNDMSRRLRSMRSLKEFVSGQNGWDYGEGFIAAKTGRRVRGDFLTNKPLLPTEAFSESGIDETRIERVKETHFRSPYTSDRYSAPLFLIKQLASLPVAFWTKGFLAYGKRIVGIHAPKSQEKQLYQLYKSIIDNHDVYRFFCILHGSESLVGWATTLRKQDIDILPVPENYKDLTLSFWEKSLLKDVLGYVADYVRLGQNSQLLSSNADTNKLQEYSEIFIKMLGSVYDNLQAAPPIFLNGLICQPFYFGEYPNLKWILEQNEKELSDLIHEDNSYAALRTIRVLRYYSGNVLLITKPDRLRYWIPSAAIKDADETLVDLLNQGY